MNDISLIKRLQNYYKECGIAAMDFHCPYLQNCQQGSPSFIEAKEAYVPTEYINRTLPRLLFISLDPGSGVTTPKYRTLENVRIDTEVNMDINEHKDYVHWYRTHELARSILRQFKNSMMLTEVKHYFAHTNSAKCTPNLKNHPQAPDRFFQNCQQYLPGEIAVLEPDIIITQGDKPNQIVNNQFIQLNIHDFVEDTKDLPEISAILVTDRPVLWIYTYHPCNRSKEGYHKQSRDNFPTYPRVASEFIKKRYGSKWKTW
jgi:hypothetical protein